MDNRICPHRHTAGRNDGVAVSDIEEGTGAGGKYGDGRNAFRRFGCRFSRYRRGI